MATPPPPSRISMGAAAVDHGAPPSGNDSGGRVAVSKPYDRDLFLAFMAAATRLFCDDEQIVVADFLANEEKAYTERDLIDRLGWPDKRVREVCASLERLMLVLREQLNAPTTQVSSSAGAEGDASSSTVGSNTEFTRVLGPGGAALLGSSASSAAPFYFRVSPYAIVVVRYRIEQLDSRLKQRRLEAESRDAFRCPVCGRQYDSLEAQRLRLDPEDAMFLCECGTKLEHEDSKAAVEHLSSLQRRCQEQLHMLRSLISRCWNMRVPVFPPFTRADKNEYKKQQDKNRQAAGSSVGSSASGGSDTQANTACTWHHPGASGVKVHISAAPPGATDGAKRPTPLWLRSGGGSVPAASNSVSSGLGSFPSAPPSSAPVPANEATAPSAGPSGGPSGPKRQRESASGSSPGSSVTGGGTRGQIKFSMKSSNKLHGLRGTPASRAAAAAAAAKANGTAAVGKRVQPTRVDFEEGPLNGQEPKGTQAQQQLTRESAQPLQSPQSEAATAPATTAAPASGAELTPQSPPPVVAEEAPRVFIARLGREFTLEEAVEYQLEMSIEEHERFMELQSMYLDDL